MAPPRAPRAMTVTAEIRDGVALLVYARPERRNSFDVEAIEAVRAAVAAAVASDEARAIVLAADGPAFCTGADVKYLAAAPERAPATIRALATSLHASIDLLHRGPKPVVTAVQGDAAGGGFGLALAGDVRFASSEARFRPAYFRLGLTPDGGLTYFLTRYAGLAEAQRILLLDATLGAEEAREIGLVHRVVAPGALRSEALATARALAAWSPASLAGTKRLLGHAWDRASTAQMAQELEAIAEAGGTARFREGLRAFLEKRTARFS